MPNSGSTAPSIPHKECSTWGFELDMPFYTWASVIVNGRVVATDYAPDAGWLVATPGELRPTSSRGHLSDRRLASDSGRMTSVSRSILDDRPNGWTAEVPGARGPEHPP